MALLHTLPCVVTGGRCEEVHHPKGPRGGCGMGKKAPAETAIPLLKRIHDEYHVLACKTWEDKALLKRVTDVLATRSASRR